MSGKLDQSLDEILSTQRRTSRGPRRGRRAPQAGRAVAVAAPVGGVKKATRTAKGAVKAVPTGPSAGSGNSKIVVSNLPKDVNEGQIKEYFVKSVGPIKRVEISYGPNGVSRGIANITFHNADGASKALKALNGLLVDGKPMKIEVLVDASRVPAIPAPKGLSERIAQPKGQAKPQPKSAAPKADTNGATGAGTRGKGRRARGRVGRNSRPAKKTAEELDSEMADYFDNAGAATTEPATNGAQPATNGDAMDDEIL